MSTQVASAPAHGPGFGLFSFCAASPKIDKLNTMKSQVSLIKCSLCKSFLLEDPYVLTSAPDRGSGLHESLVSLSLSTFSVCNFLTRSDD